MWAYRRGARLRANTMRVPRRSLANQPASHWEKGASDANFYTIDYNLVGDGGASRYKSLVKGLCRCVAQVWERADSVARSSTIPDVRRRRRVACRIIGLTDDTLGCSHFLHFRSAGSHNVARAPGHTWPKPFYTCSLRYWEVASSALECRWKLPANRHQRFTIKLSLVWS